MDCIMNYRDADWFYGDGTNYPKAFADTRETGRLTDLDAEYLGWMSKLYDTNAAVLGLLRGCLIQVLVYRLIEQRFSPPHGTSGVECRITVGGELVRFEYDAGRRHKENADVGGCDNSDPEHLYLELYECKADPHSLESSNVGFFDEAVQRLEGHDIVPCVVTAYPHTHALKRLRQIKGKLRARIVVLDGKFISAIRDRRLVDMWLPFEPPLAS